MSITILGITGQSEVQPGGVGWTETYFMTIFYLTVGNSIGTQCVIYKRDLLHKHNDPEIFF